MIPNSRFIPLPNDRRVTGLSESVVRTIAFRCLEFSPSPTMDTALIFGSIILRARTTYFSYFESAMLSHSCPNCDVFGAIYGLMLTQLLCPSGTPCRENRNESPSWPRRISFGNRSTLYVLSASSILTIKAGYPSEEWSSCSDFCPCSALVAVLAILIVTFVGLRVPSTLMEIGSASRMVADLWNGYPLNNVPRRNRFSTEDGSCDSVKSTSSLRVRISPMTRGEPRWARIRSTSRIDDLPLLFVPVIKFTRPSSLMLSSRKPRYRSTVNSRTFRSTRPPPAHCSVTVDIGTSVATASCSQRTMAACNLLRDNRNILLPAKYRHSGSSGIGAVGLHFDPCACCAS